MGSADHKIRKMTTLLEGPASGLSGIFPQSGPTGGMGMAPPISIPTTEAPGSQFPAMSAMSSTTSTTSTSTSSVGLPHSPTQPLLEAAKLYFGENLQSTIFAYRVDQGDLLQTLRDYESLSVPQFLPATTHPHSRSQSWFSDALDEGAYNVESLLMPALKAMLMATRGTTEEAQQHQEDAMMLTVAALQAARHMRIQARFGFKAAKTLQEEKDDPLLTTEQLERIKPMLQARTERRQGSSASHLSQRTRRIGSWKSRSTSSGTGRSTRAASRSNFFGESRGPHPSLCRGMEEDRSDQLDKRRDKTDLEGESCKGQVETGKDERQRLPGWHRGKRGLFRMDSRRTQDRYINTVTRRRGLLLEQHIFHKEKDREVPSNPRLPCTQFRTERYSFQNGRPSHCGETDPKGRFRNLTRSISGLFPDPSSQGIHPIPSLQVRREILRVQRHALRIQRRTENFHESHEKSFARNPKKMEGEVHFLLGRCPIAGSRSSQAEVGNTRNCRVVSTVGLNHQQGEERVLPQEELQLSRMDVEYEPDGCLNGTTETQGTEERVYQMDEEGEEEQLCKNERLRFIHRSAQRRTVRVQRRLFIHEQNVPFTEQAGQERWLGRSGSLEQQHKKTIGHLDSKAQGELHQRTGGLLEARRHINDRCFPLGLRSDLGSWRREISLSQTVQQHHKAPNIQFQGAPCSFIGSQQFFITNHSQPCVQDPSPFRQHQCSVQHQQVGCGTQPPAVIEKDQGHMSVDEIDDDSNPHSRGEKHNRRRIVQVGGRRRLYDKESMSEGSGEGSRSDSRDRRFRKRRKQEEGDMVWSRKSVRSRWSHGRLDKEHNAHSPSHSVDSSESQESKSRESESNHPSSGMEESDMEQLTGRDDVSTLRLEELESGFNPGSRPEENGCSTASRGIHGSNNQLVREVGEEWWWKSLRICGVPDRIISVTKESIAKSTWNQYTFGFAHFSREWEELKLGPFPKYFDEWSMDCANCLLSMRDKGGKYSCLCATRSAISLFSKTVYGKDLSKVSLISTIFRSFSFSQTHRKPYTKMWSPDIVLSYYENYGLNEYLSFFDLTVKCSLLVMLFTSCRFHELEQISMANSIFESDAIYLSTRLKTSRSREYITVPCLEEVHKRICPARAIHTLWERVKATYENRDTFLLNTTHHTPLTAKGIRTLARIGLRKAGVPDEYRPYTIKHASISKLASSGVPEVCIAKHARLSTTAHTPSRSYYKANLANRMARALLASEEDSSQQDESTVVEKSCISKQIEGIPFCATQQTTTIMFGLPPLQPLNHADSTAEPFSTQAPSPDLPSQQTFPATQPNQAIIFPTSVEEPEDNNTAKRNEPEITRGEPETDRTDIRTEICKCKDLPNYEHSLNKEVL